MYFVKSFWRLHYRRGLGQEWLEHISRLCERIRSSGTYARFQHRLGAIRCRHVQRKILSLVGGGWKRTTGVCGKGAIVIGWKGGIRGCRRHGLGGCVLVHG